jgi:hypothetical protein
MRVFRSARRWPILAAVLPLALLTASCGDDDSPTGTGGGTGGGAVTVPASWGGTWQITTTPTAPGPGPRGGGGQPEVGIVPICAGLTVEDLLGIPSEIEGLVDLTCSGTWNDTLADVTCTGDGAFSTCTFTVTVELDLVKSGEEFTGTQTISINFDATCEIPDLMETIDLTARRLDTSQFACDPTLDDSLPASWGGIWDLTITASGRGGPTLLCPGENVRDVLFSDVFVDMEVVGGFTDSVGQIVGAYGETIGPCEVLTLITYDLTRNGNTITGTGNETVYTVPDPNQTGGGECSGVTSTDYDITGTRTSPDISGCEALAPPPIRLPRAADFGLLHR